MSKIKATKSANINFGVILGPALSSEKTEAETLAQDLRLVRFLDQLGFDSLWVGGNNEKFIADSRQLTKQITIGRVVSKLSNTSTNSYANTKVKENLAVLSQGSPAASITAGSHGLKLLSLNATTPGGFNALKPNWEIYCRNAIKNNHSTSQQNWSVAGPMHVATSRKQATQDVQHGLQPWIDGLSKMTGLQIVPDNCSDPVSAMIDSGFAVIGTPTDAIAQIRRLKEETGGFGSFLFVAQRWANWQQTCRSYELIAEKVMPKF